MTRRRQPRRLNRDDYADRERSTIARIALLSLLVKDLRVQAALSAWAATPQASNCITTVTLVPDDTIARLAWERERPTLERSVMADLPCTAPWLPAWLADACLITVLGAVWQRRIEMVFTMTPGQPFATSTRRAKNEGRTVRRDVSWLYRARIKNPKDSARSLARAYAANNQRRTIAQSVVQDAIARAAVWLDLAWSST